MEPLVTKESTDPIYEGRGSGSLEGRIGVIIPERGSVCVEKALFILQAVRPLEMLSISVLKKRLLTYFGD